MGRKDDSNSKSSRVQTLALTTDASGKVKRHYCHYAEIQHHHLLRCGTTLSSNSSMGPERWFRARTQICCPKSFQTTS
jgi:hypothetical protein